MGTSASPTLESCKTRESCSRVCTAVEQTCEFASGRAESEFPEQKHHIDSENVQSEPAGTSILTSSSIVHLPPKSTTENLLIDRLGPPQGDLVDNSSIQQLGQLCEDMTENPIHEQLGRFPKDVMENSSQLQIGNKRTSAKQSKKKYKQRFLVGSTRILRSKSREKPIASEPSDNMSNARAGRKRKRMKKRRNEILRDEFSNARKHLRYFLQRMSYDQNLIDAYSGEGWKGQSLDKLKPEKELQRAKSEILRRKVKIRDLFQHLDSLCTEGRLSDSLFDAEGQIDSEDIFCAKCGSKDLSTNDDIILCDGACERGFHQLCLEPPLLRIPPGDEGWLCPACDCKVDCLDLLNDSQGTDLSITDSWEKVFPEAAAAAAGGNKHDQSFGFSSDDSEDNDYDPDVPDADEGVQGDESSPDESDFTSASGDLEVSRSDGQNMGLPSDDSEDDDYEPDALDLDEQTKPESSSSDFTSDSEDLTTALEDKTCLEKVENPSLDHSKATGCSNGKRSKLAGNKNSLRDELLTTLESSPGLDDSTPVSGKRHVERLDYKKLYDETYGNISSDSSDDEDWTETNVPKKRNKKTREVSPLQMSPTMKNGRMTNDLRHNLKDSEHSQRRTHENLKIEGVNDSPAKSYEGSSGPGSSARKVRRSAYKRLGEAVTQGLYKYFKDNQYPDRVAKEKMAKELGITLQQVTKWFENARWSFHHGHSQKKDAPTCKTKRNLSQLEQELPSTGTACNGADSAPTELHAKDVRETRLVIEDTKQKSTPNSRHQKGKSCHQASDKVSGVGTLKPSAHTPKGQEVRKPKTYSKNRKTVA
ncbi:homeobox protein HAT3.1 isoform X2 [Malania oleifera]|uniref:homeobox protein HAT3.1 isoform X2 n=1 Tax=Malania oleifera TaxID=397392 RepID=UPI0025ADF6C0|nr:homeobox protein HAT3.1 isoform X2 [Malania oleifera]